MRMKEVLMIFGMLMVLLAPGILAMEQNLSALIVNGTEITGESYSPLCAFGNSNVNFMANVTFKDCSGDVWVSIKIGNGTWINYTAPRFVASNYSFTLDSSLLIEGKNVSWQFFARDCYNLVYNGSLNKFYVRDNTNVIVNPLSPDGQNGWYVTEPLFSILGDASLVNKYYQWDSSTIFRYTSPFRLENIPNQPNVTAGIQRLNYWSEFSCGNESKNNQTFYMDLIDPLIIDLTPDDGEIVFNRRPAIGAYLDDVYNGNSGINKNMVVMRLDGNYVSSRVLNADTVDAIVRYNPSEDLLDGVHEVSVYVEDNAGRSTVLNWSFSINTTIPNFNLSVFSPVDSNYGDRRVGFNITTSREIDEMEYIDYNDNRPRWRRLCRNCDGYGVDRIRTKSMKEGDNNIGIRATDEFGNTKESNASFFVDSKLPKISNVLPKKNSYTNGSDFYVKYTEDNLKGVSLSFNPTIPINNCNESGKNIECYFTYNLSLYDGQKIEYSINVSDSIRSVESKKVKIIVDTTSPIINNLSYEKDGKKVDFKIYIDEDNLDEVIYVYEDGWDTKEKRLCSRLNKGICEGKAVFNNGQHDVEIIVKDKAGNSVSQALSFLVDSKIPKVKKTYPEKGFANGDFSVEFQEDSPVLVVFNYGVEEDMLELNVSLGGCIINDDKYTCDISVNLSYYDGSKINYWFSVKDVAGNVVDSKITELDVDMTAPVLLNSYSFWHQGIGRKNKYIYFDMKIDEDNFDEVSYIDWNDNNSRERRLCSRLKNGVCETKRSFRNGDHNLTVYIKDEAGNSVEKNFGFEVL